MTIRTAFVTGASGFVGVQLTKRLAESGVSVRCLVRKTSLRAPLEKLGVEFVEGDVGDMNALRKGADGADAVFHIAGLTQAFSFEEYLSVNRDGCRNAAQAVADTMPADNPPVFIAVSSLAAAGAGRKLPRAERKKGTSKYYRLQETDAPNPVSPYGRSKLAGEQELLSFSEKFPVSILRPSIIFGEGDKLSFPLFKVARYSPFFWIPGYFNPPFSYVYVQDLVTLMLRAAESGERLTPQSHEAGNGKGIYFATAPSDYDLTRFGNLLRKAVRRKIPICPCHCPPRALLVYAAFAERYKQKFHVHVPIDWDKAKEALGGPWICSSEKAVAHFGDFYAAPFLEELKRTADWYFENRKLR